MDESQKFANPEVRAASRAASGGGTVQLWPARAARGGWERDIPGQWELCGEGGTGQPQEPQATAAPQQP